MAGRVLQRMTSVNVYLSLAVPVNKPLSRAFARRLDTQSVEKSISVNPALEALSRNSCNTPQQLTTCYQLPMTPINNSGSHFVDQMAIKAISPEML